MPQQERQKKDARLDLRLSSDAKILLQKAAIISGLDLSAFTLSAAVEKADLVVARHDTRVLSDRDRDRFLKILEQKEPNQKLVNAIKKYKALQNGR